MSRWRQGLRELAGYPSAVGGLALIAFLVALSVYTVIAIPYSEALDLWRGGEHWRTHPVNAGPVWADRVVGGNKPTTITVGGEDAQTQTADFEGGRQLRVPLSFDYGFDDFPSELNLFLETGDTDREAFVRLRWRTPDGETVSLGGQRISGDARVAISQDQALEGRLGAPPQRGLFTVGADGDVQSPQEGRYTLIVDAILFGEDPSLDAELAVYGRVHGLAGTDHQRRDLMVALLWGTPVALAFGLLAAVGTTVTTLVIAATGVWFGGLVDAVIQRLTEINIILPLLPILVMVGTLYSTSI
ncbi:MAG: ABC transporter permease, partial [Ectothiorhodospiraceae bacterium]